jgi:hypothetical protein
MRHIALRSAYHAPWLGTTHPMPPATFRPGAVFLLQTQAVLSWATHVDGRHAALLLRYSYASASLPVAVFSALRFSRIPAAQALCADVDNSSTKCGDYPTGVEASRQLVMMQPWPPSLPAEAHFSADYPLRRIAAPLWYPSPCLVCMFFLRSGSFSYGIREEYDTPAWSDITPAVEALR